jgi:hypothetical protein
MLNAAVNRLTALASESAPISLLIDLWGDIAHLQESRDELPV